MNRRKKFYGNLIVILFSVAAVLVFIVAINTNILVNAFSIILRKNIEDTIRLKSKLAAGLISEREFAEMTRPEDMEKPLYGEIKKRLSAFSEEEDVLFVYYYYHIPEGNILQPIIDNDYTEGSYSLLSNPLEMEKSPQEILDTGKAVTTGLGDYSAGFEGIVSAFAPVFGADGRIIALAGVDISDEDIINIPNRILFLSLSLLVSIGFVIFSGFLSFFIYRKKEVMFIKRFAQQDVMAKLAKSLITSTDTETLITDALRITGEFLNVSRMIVGVPGADTNAGQPTYAWCAAGMLCVSSSVDVFGDRIRNTFPPEEPLYGKAQAVYCGNTGDDKQGEFGKEKIMGGPGDLGPFGSLSGGVAGARQAAFAAIRNSLRGVAEARRAGARGSDCKSATSPLQNSRRNHVKQYEALAVAGINAFIWTPLYVDGKFWAVLSIEDCVDSRQWSASDRQLVSTVSSVIAAAMARDRRERERDNARRQAEQASRAKSDFLANMSHEMRTPMNAVIGMTSIAKTSRDIEKKEYCLNKIEEASVHLLGVINDILDMSKIEANKFDLSVVEFEFEKMLRKVVNVINFRVEERRQDFSVHIDRHIPRFLRGDDQRLAQVIANLLSNAVKFTPDYGSLRLDTKLEKEEEGLCTISISVADSGIGISKEQQGRLFSSFEQADSSTSRKFGGTGLGLAISRRIVEMMGGGITVDSELNKGSTFTITVKLKRGEGKQESLLKPGINWSNLRILVVDDADYIRDFFQSFAEEVGISCLSASNGNEAEALIERQGPFDIYFVDWKMPGMNGIELSRRIIAHANGVKPVVILISAAEWSEIEVDARSAGVDKFLSKPLFPSAIADCINQCLGEDAVAAKALEIKAMDAFPGCRILLAEDVEINREIVLTLLEPTGVRIDCAENGRQAVQLFNADPFSYDLIFLDVQMPEMDGYEAARQIRASAAPNAKIVPIIAMTANVFKEDVEKCLSAGMDDHIGKPLDIADVLEVMRKYLPEKRGNSL